MTPNNKIPRDTNRSRYTNSTGLRLSLGIPTPHDPIAVRGIDSSPPRIRTPLSFYLPNTDSRAHQAVQKPRAALSSYLSALLVLIFGRLLYIVDFNMLTRRLVPRLQPSSALARTLSTTTPQQRSPSLADITPNGAPKFDARQKEFREGLRAAQKEKEKQDSQSVANSKHPSDSDPTAQSASNADSSSLADVALGSLSTHQTGAARQSSSKDESSKRKGALSSLIYGTHEGQQMDQEIEKSFSQVLARGKYVHSIVLHSVKPDKVDEYSELVGSWYPRMAKLEKNHVNLVGSWRTEVGDCDTFGKIFWQSRESPR